MEIRLEDFKAPRLEKEEVFSPFVVDQWLLGYEGFRNSGEIYTTAHFTKRSANILMQAKLKGNIIGPCARCLEDAIIPIDTELTIMFIPASQERKYNENEEIELESEELDVEYYKGNRIEVDYLLRESLLLAIPFSPLCSESCKGLCPTCGGNLNKGECSCTTETLFNNIKINLF